MTDLTKSIEKNIITGLPYKFRCRWFGKYDEEFGGFSPTGIGKTESDLTDYDGLNYTKKIIEDINIERIGALTVSGYNVSGFSAAKYMRLPDAFLPESNSWEIVWKVKTGSSVTSQQFLFGSSTGYYDTVGAELNSSGKFGIGFSANGSSWNISWLVGTTVLTTNTWYWLKISFTGTEYKVELSTDGETYNLENSVSSSTPIYQNASTSLIYLGTLGDKSKYWGGQIDLEECKIKINGEVVWRGTRTVCTVLDFADTKLPWKWGYQNMLKTKKYVVAAQNTTFSYYDNAVNGTIAGSPVINSDKNMSGFSSSNYLTMLSAWNPAGKPWKISLKINSGTVNSTAQYLFGQSSSGANKGTPQMCIENGYLKIWLSSDHSAWNIADGVASSITLSGNTNYTVMLEFTGEAYNVKVDGTTVTTITTSIADYSGSYPLIMGFDHGGGAFSGFVDLKESFIEIDGKEVWRGFKKTTLPGCISGSNDASGLYHCYAINGDDHIELQKQTGSMIIVQNITPRYLGEVSVSDVYHWSDGTDPNIPV